MSTPPISTQSFVSPLLSSDPEILRAGDSWTWRKTFDEFNPQDGWELQYILNSPTSQFKFPDDKITIDDEREGFLIALGSDETKTATPGTYDLVAVLTNSRFTPSQRFTKVIQQVIVQANILDAGQAVDTRSFVKRTLDTLEAAIAGNASPEVVEYEIAGRRVRMMSLAELTKLRDQYQWKYEQERAKAGGYVRKRRVGIRFGTGGL